LAVSGTCLTQTMLSYGTVLAPATNKLGKVPKISRQTRFGQSPFGGLKKWGGWKRQGRVR
jgi:hypothetical protein